MKFNAFKVCHELTLRIDGAPAPNGFMKAYTSEKKDRLFGKKVTLFGKKVMKLLKKAESEGSKMNKKKYKFLKSMQSLKKKFTEADKTTVN